MATDGEIYRVGSGRRAEFVRLLGGRIVETSGGFEWAKGLSFGFLRKECVRRKLRLTSRRGDYVFVPEGIGYGD